jgi:dUTP pyrophosphatase
LDPAAKMPFRATEGSAGLDLYALGEHVVSPYAFKTIGTGLSIQPGRGFFMKIESRSSLAVRGVVSQAGILDPDHRGEVSVVLYNFSRLPFEIKSGDRIAQMVPYAYKDVNVVEVDYDSLQSTTRGRGGFGSTGV